MKNIKTLFFLLFMLACIIKSQAQSNFDARKFIEVTGSAEMTIQPDEIELEIILVEYDKNGQKVKLKTVENEFYEILKKNSINTNSLTLNSSEAYYWWYWWSYRDRPYTRKTLNLNLSKETNILKLVEDLNKKWIESIRIASTKNKDIQKYRKEVKIEAVKAAKEKATYLLESVGEQIGNVISIEEIPENNNYWYKNSNLLSNSIMSPNSTNDNDDAIKNVASIKLRYEIKAKFEIK